MLRQQFSVASINFAQEIALLVMQLIYHHYSSQNYVRVVEVWWDEYADYFYASRPETKAMAYGDITPLKKFREEHHCKSFKWFMEEIAYDIPEHYPLPAKNIEWGEVKLLIHSRLIYILQNVSYVAINCTIACRCMKAVCEWCHW